MADLVRFVQRDDLPPLTQAVIAHAQFETIHPFPDGNGRVGRSLIHAILRSKNLTRKITVPVSAGLLTGIDRYFDALKSYQLGDPNPLVHHLADASFAAIGNGRQLVGDLHRVRDRWDEVMTMRSDASARRIADLLLRQPVINSTLVSSELGDVPASTALRGIGALVDAGVLKKISGSSRYHRWAAAEVLTCLDDFSERAGRRGRPSRARTDAPAVRASEPLEPAAGVSDSTQVSTPPPHRKARSQTQPSLSAPIRPPTPQEEPAAPAARVMPAAAPSPAHPLGAPLAQVLDTYIIAIAADGALVLVDQHAAHERLTHEALRAQFHAGGVRAQPLLLPAVVDLPAVEAIDTGVDLSFFAVQPPNTASEPGRDGGTLVFTATMSWAANVDGIHFLLDEVFPLLLPVRPRIKAFIIGRNPPASLSEKIKASGLNITLTGFVEDIRPYVAQANVYVIPLFVGSGTRIKAFEAMAMGRPVVSTALGIEGLEVTDGENFLRADDAAAFARSILALMDDAAMRDRIAQAARRLMEERFSWTRVARQFEAICLRTLEHHRHGPVSIHLHERAAP
jgi:hypothetical protein